jgi:hypothetical protein
MTMEEKMKIRKIFPVLLLAGMFLVSSAWAGNYPEFDAVGVDQNNFFAKNNIAYKMVTEYFGKNKVEGLYALEEYSNFTEAVMGKYKVSQYEKFYGSAGLAYTDPCWKEFKSVLTTIQRDGSYEWYIVLQMQPESDIDLNIYDCVMKWQGADHGGLWGNADQTGRFRADWGKLFFVPCSAPDITVVAYPGPFATNSFKDMGKQVLDARKMPGLWRTSLDEKWYTSKAHWDESIVIALPETGYFNERGDANFQLVQGDIIYVKIQIPETNTVDIYYGADSVVLKYIGMSNTEFLGDNK